MVRTANDGRVKRKLGRASLLVECENGFARQVFGDESDRKGQIGQLVVAMRSFQNADEKTLPSIFRPLQKNRGCKNPSIRPFNKHILDTAVGIKACINPDHVAFIDDPRDRGVRGTAKVAFLRHQRQGLMQGFHKLGGG